MRVNAHTKTIKKRRKGFSIAEVLLAAAVLSIGLVAILEMTSVSIRTTSANEDVIVATGLAQEGVELVRNIRDTNFAERADKRKNGNTSDDNDPDFDEAIPMNTSLNSPLSCLIDYDGKKKPVKGNDCPSSVNAGTYLLNINDFYQHTSAGTATKFRRKVVLTKLADTDTSGTTPVYGELQVDSVVWWSGVHDITNLSTCNIGNKCVKMSSVLTDWY